MKNIRKKFTEISKSCRRPYPPVDDLNKPLSTKSDEIIFNGKLVTRKRIILFTVGCGIGTCVMCPFPAESNYAVTEENLINQFNNAFENDSFDNYEMITIFCNGNFFNEKEISQKVVDYIFCTLGKSNIKAITVESLPQYLTKEKILKAKRMLGDKILQVFMGLQSANDDIRQLAINSTCSKQSFERVVRELKEVDFEPAAFIIVKAPFLTEYEGIRDALNTLFYLDNIGVKNSTLCPMRISDNTMLKKIYDAGYYQPLQLLSIVLILYRYHMCSGIGMPMVNTSELKQNLNLDSICAQYDGFSTSEIIISVIEKYLYSRNILDLKYNNSVIMSADMSKFYSTISQSTMIDKDISIQNRINNFIYGLENIKR